MTLGCAESWMHVLRLGSSPCTYEDVGRITKPPNWLGMLALLLQQVSNLLYYFLGKLE